MKTIAIENLEKDLESLIRAAPKSRVLLTRNGQPFAFVSDASNYDWEDIGYMTDPEFCKMIAQRRKEKAVPFKQVLAELEEKEKAQHVASRKKNNGKHRTKNGRSAA
jgi:hypothetical protein